MAARTNQKERTRQALLEAARVIMSDGLELTISGAAAVARVSSATAYRYFSQPQQLALEAVADRASGVIADLPDAPAERLDEVVRRLAELQLGDERLWRAVLVASLQRWSAEPADAATPLRSGARREMTRRALEPLEPVLDPAQHRRLTSAVMLVHGMEAMVSARDACGSTRPRPSRSCAGPPAPCSTRPCGRPAPHRTSARADRRVTRARPAGA